MEKQMHTFTVHMFFAISRQGYHVEIQGIGPGQKEKRFRLYLAYDSPCGSPEAKSGGFVIHEW